MKTNILIIGQGWAGLYKSRGVSGGWAGWEIAHPDFGRLEGFSRNKLDFIMAKIGNRLLTRMKSSINAMWQFYAL